jgi:hypothetical protein
MLSRFDFPDSEFLAMAHGVCVECEKNKELWELREQPLARLKTLYEEARANYEANCDWATKNSTTSSNKRFSFNDLKRYLIRYTEILRLTLSVPDSALQAMGLGSRECVKRGPIPQPTDRIVIFFSGVGFLVLARAVLPATVFPADPVETRLHYGFVRKIRIEGKEAEMLVTSRLLTSTLYFEEGDAGKEAFVSAAWVNPKMETGPWSEEVGFVIGEA